MERVLDVYKRPYNSDFPVICMDESPRQLIRETRTATEGPGIDALIVHYMALHNAKGQ